MQKSLLLFPILFISACTHLPSQKASPKVANNQHQNYALCNTSHASQSGHCLQLELASYRHRKYQKKQIFLSDRKANLYMGAGMAGLNNPQNPSGDVDNLAIAVGGKLATPYATFRPELQMGERSYSFNPSVTHDFQITGNGLGAIDGNFGIGYSLNKSENNNVLGNSDSAFIRIGAEGYLDGNIVSGIALMIAPWGYNSSDTAIAGVGYLGVSF